MLSRVVALAESGAIHPMVWEHAAGPTESTKQPERFCDAAPDRANMDLELKIAELENSVSRAATDSRDAREAGFHDGEAQGRAQGTAAVQPAMDQMCRAVQALADLRPRLRRDAESDVVQLAIAIARRILHRELTVDPGAMQALVQVALEKLGRQEICRVRVHASHEDAIRSCLGKLTQRTIEVLGDTTRELGSLVFETNRGKLDASVETQLEEIERGLVDRVHAR
ncbi:MAG: FliH/SctL family protein [Acidobacteriota bacterium]|nr:FliH/SctL family protein [Acidobacteriota bacterium]